MSKKHNGKAKNNSKADIINESLDIIESESTVVLDEMTDISDVYYDDIMDDDISDEDTVALDITEEDIEVDDVIAEDDITEADIIGEDDIVDTDSFKRFDEKNAENRRGKTEKRIAGYNEKKSKAERPKLKSSATSDKRSSIAKGSKDDSILKKIGNFVLKYQKLVYPGLALIAAAVVVVIVLNVQKNNDRNGNIVDNSITVNDPVLNVEDLSVPLETNSDELVNSLLNSYYGCLSDGDSQKLASLCDIIDESELLRYEEQAKYLSYNVNEIYTQAGPEDGTYVAYVYSYVIFDKYPELNFPAYKGFYIKTNESGSMYIVNGELTAAENDYIIAVQNQDDVIELNNKVNVEYNELVLDNQYILDYLVELDSIISTAVGERIAMLNASAPDDSSAGNDNGSTVQDVPLENVTIYAKATTSVNVRKSDSADSDRLGEVAQGTKLEVVEELVNGWTKVIYEGQEAYIKSEFLMIIKSADGVSTIGMMTALDNVNIRSEASTESDILGALVTGAQYEIAAIENGWVTIKFDGILAYVSAEYCDCTMF